MELIHVGEYGGFSPDGCAFRGATCHIRVSNASRAGGGVRAVTVDGSPISGALLPVVPEGQMCHVEVVL